MTFIEAEKGRDVRENYIACSSHSGNADESYGNIYMLSRGDSLEGFVYGLEKPQTVPLNKGSLERAKFILE